jgi:hypothetical protein
VVVACLDGVAATVPRPEDLLPSWRLGTMVRAVRPVMAHEAETAARISENAPPSVVLDPSAHETV